MTLSLNSSLSSFYKLTSSKKIKKKNSKLNLPLDPITPELIKLWCMFGPAALSVFVSDDDDEEDDEDVIELPLAPFASLFSPFPPFAAAAAAAATAAAAAMAALTAAEDVAADIDADDWLPSPLPFKL